MSWLIVNASPDLRAQIESFPPLQPAGDKIRHSPIRDVLLSNADLDHVLGLFQLRELGQPLRVHCTASVRETLSHALGLDKILDAFCRVEWCTLSETPAPITTGLICRAIELDNVRPRYDADSSPSVGQSVALEFLDEQGTHFLVAPDVAAVTPELQSALEACRAVLFDGTFWSDDELQQIDLSARTAAEMGHLSISNGSLDLLRNLTASHRVYLHINNTNPILLTDSPERAEVEKAGVAIGEDGMEFEL